MDTLVQVVAISEKIHHIRKKKVLLDRDLAELYGIATRILKQAVRRNIRRFPEDFMFELTQEEEASLRSQSVILKGRGQHSKYQAFAFTEQGVAMLSSVLQSERAIEVNIAIMRAFVQMREMLAGSRKFAAKLQELEKRLGGHDDNFQIVFTGPGSTLARRGQAKTQDRLLNLIRFCLEASALRQFWHPRKLLTVGLR